MHAVAINSRQEGRISVQKTDCTYGIGEKPNVVHTSTDDDGALYNEATHKCLNDNKSVNMTRTLNVAR